MGKNDDTAIVRFWDCVTKKILLPSVPETIKRHLIRKYLKDEIEKKPLDKIQEKPKEKTAEEKEQERKEKEKKERESKLYNGIDYIVIGMSLLSIVMSMILYYGIKSNQTWVLYFFIVFGGYRLTEIVAIQIRLWFFDCKEEERKNEAEEALKKDEGESSAKTENCAGGSIKDIRRSIFLLLHNVIEIIFVFTYLIMATILLCSSESTPFLLKAKFGFWELLKCSLYYFFDLKEEHIRVMEALPGNTWLQTIVFCEQLVRIFMIGVVVTKLLALMPRQGQLRDR